MAIEDTSASFFSSLSSFFLPTAYADTSAPETDEKEEESSDDAQKSEEPEAVAEPEAAPEAEAEEEADTEEEEAAGDDDDDEDEPEDQAPAIRAECEKVECKEPAKHFQHCAEKVEAGKGWHGEDCVEELFHLMHCVDSCAAPKLFKKLA